MPDIKNNIKAIYNALNSEGYKDLGSEQDFANAMQYEEDRKTAYNLLKKHGYSGFGENENEFSSLVYQRPNTNNTGAQINGSTVQAVNPNGSDLGGILPKGQGVDSQPAPEYLKVFDARQIPEDFKVEGDFVNNPIIVGGKERTMGDVANELYRGYDNDYRTTENKKANAWGRVLERAKAMGLDEDQAAQLAGGVDKLYRQNLATDLAEGIYQRMYKEGDPLTNVEDVLYDKDFSQIIADTAAAVGYNNVGTYIEHDLKPALNNMLQKKFGGYNANLHRIATDIDDIRARVSERERKKAEEDRLRKQVEEMKLEGERLQEQGTAMQQQDRPWWAGFVPAAAGGVNAYDVAAQERRNPDADRMVRTGRAIQYMAGDAQAAINEDNILHTQKTTGLTNQIKNAFGRVIRGGAHAIADVRTWDFGFTELNNATAVKAAADAYAKNKATAEQKTLLNAVALKNVIMSKHGEALEGLYGAGTTTVQMIPFMAQFAFSPVKGVGPAAQKYCRTQLEKTFGKYATEAVGKFVVKGGELAGRFVGDLAQGAAMTTTFNMADVLADTKNRMTGDLEATTDDKGNIVYSGKRTNAKSGGRAFTEAFAARTIENQSELVGEYFTPLLSFMQKGTVKALDKLSLNKTKNFLTGLNNKEIVKGFNTFVQKTQWHGTLGEYGEEVVGNIENALFVGDLNMNLDTEDDNSVFSKKLNYNTFLGVALGGGIISIAHTANYLHVNRKVTTALNDADVHGDVIFGTERWEEIKSEIENAPDEKAGELLKTKMESKELNSDQKKTIAEYTKNLYIKRGSDISQLKNALEGNVSAEQEEAMSAYENGHNATDEQLNEIKVALDDAEKNASELLGEEILDVLDEIEDVDTFKNSDAFKSYTREQKEAAVRYMIARTAYKGMIERVQDDINSAVNKSNAEIDNLTHKESESIIRATLKDADREVYIVSGNVAMSADGKNVDTEKSDKNIVVYDAQKGKKEMLDIHDFLSVDTPIDAESYKADRVEEVKQEIAQREAARIDGVRTFHYDDIVKIQDKDGNLIDGVVQDVQGDEIVVVSDAYQGGKTYTAAELTAMQPQPQTVAENATVEQQTEEAVAGNESNEVPAQTESEVNSPQVETETEAAQPTEQPSIPTDEKGNLLYHQAPVELTIKDLYDGTLDDAEIADFVSANIEAAQKEYDKVAKKAPKIGTDKGKYLQEKKAYQEEVAEVKRKVDYWEAVETARQELTHTTKAEIEAKENELNGDAARSEYQDGRDTDDSFATAEDMTRDFLRDAKITPESFREETGLGVAEQRKLVGMISNQGDTIAKLGERLAEYDELHNGGIFFHGDSNEARSAIINAIISSKSVSDFKASTDTTAEDKYAEEVERQRDEWYYNNYHLTYEEYLQYEETLLPELLRKYANFAEEEFYRDCAVIFEEIASQENTQTIKTENNDKQGTDTTAEEQGTDRSTTVLPGEKTGNSGRDSQSQEQGREVQTGLQGEVENATVSETAQGEVDKEPLSEEAAQSLITSMEENAIEDPEIRLTPQTWLETFGINNSIDTPIGKVRMGENQYVKLQDKKRTSEFGMVSLTLSDPDVIFVEPSKAKGEDVAERNFSYVFAKTFKRNGNKVKYYTSVTVSIDGLEISVSSHFVNPNKMLNKLMEFNREYTKETLFSNSSEMRLAEHQSDVPDLLPTQENNVSSIGKDTQSSQTKQENEDKFAAAPRKEGESILDFAERVAAEHQSYQERKTEEAKVDTNPTDAQKEAGNYKKGHIKVDGLNITIEQPKGSIRRGTDANGKQWESEMHNTYGYIRGTESVDGDHIDIFLSDNPTEGNVFVVDQINKDGSFDEHKVMYGFPDMESAKRAYLSNYEEGWQGLGSITEVKKEDFKKWIDSSKRKTKPFAEYSTVKTQGDVQTKKPTEAELRERKKQELKNKLKAKLRGQLNVGVDPELFMIGVELASMEIEDGARKFVDFAKKMISEIGDEIRPYLKSIYNGTRDLPGMESLSEEMTPYDEVRVFNVATIGKETEDVKPSVFDTAEQISNEQAVEHSAKEEAKNTVETEDVDNDAYSITKQHNNKKDIDIWVVRGKERTDKDVFIQRKQAARSNNGYYSSFRGVNGFVFDTPEDARTFADNVFNIQSDEKDGQINTLSNENYAHNSEDIMHEDKDIDKESDKTETPPHGLKVGDKVLYKGKEATIFDFDNGKPVLDTGLAPVVYDVVEMDAIKPIDKQEQVAADVKENLTEEKTEAKAEETNNKTLSSHVEGNLFDAAPTESLTNKDKNDEVHVRNGGSTAKREQGHEPRQNEPLGESKQNEAQRPDGQRMGGRDTTHSRTDAERSGGLPDISKSKQRLNTTNNHGERGIDYAPTSVDARIEANIQAIELANELIENGEKATPQQMAVLRKFSGWGGLGKAFNETVNGYYGEVNKTPRKLKELLGEEAYNNAIESANSSYYTPAHVIDTLWDIAEKLGFKGGNILEGSAGIGNIIGQIPTHLSENSNIHAVEKDPTAGSMLSLLYPEAKVDIQGFEETYIPNGSIDLAITNVPFVTGLRVWDTTSDKDLSKKFHDIHNFCIAKNVRKLREGGIGIFISSNGTLDNSQKLCDWVVSEGNADFIGAFRLNNKTFLGTSVTSDIIVIRKRINGKKSTNAIDVSTVTGERTADFDTGETKRAGEGYIPVIKHLSMDYNKYFIEHPENMAGEMAFAFEHGETYRATTKGLYPAEDKPQDKLLKDFVNSLTAKQEQTIADSEETDNTIYETLGSDVKEGSMIVSNGELCIAQYGQAVPLGLNANKVKGHTKQECFNAYTEIKQALDNVLTYETENADDKGLQPLLDKLNKVYDDFVNTYGHFHKNTAISFLRKDVDYPNVLSLEIYKEENDAKNKRVRIFSKTDVFSKRVVTKETEPKPDNIKDGVIVSIYKNGRIDIPYISKQLNLSEDAVREEIINSGLGFEDPVSKEIEVSYKYLSGNVREKLQQAEDNNENGAYNNNIKALKEVIPANIPAHLIEFNLGSSWVTPKLYEDYTKEKTGIEVKFVSVGGTWFMKAPEYGLGIEQNRSMGVHSTIVQKTILGHELIEAAIQNKTITVSKTQKDWDGKTETIVDKEATQACGTRIDEIRQEFKDWARGKMQSDIELNAEIERIYNETFNNYVPIDIPSDFIPKHFGGSTHNITLRPHQAKAVVRGTMQPLMLAHEVGTGKTFTLISTAMEMRRLGTARKPMIVVQNATVGQFVASAKALYPNAKILTLENADHGAEGRKRFYAKIRYNDWDMIVVPQSTFEFIPDSEERQIAFIKDKVEEKMIVLEKMREADESGQSFMTRRAEKELEQLQEELATLTDNAAQKRNEKQLTAKELKKKEVSKQNAEVKAREMLDRRTDDVENFDDMGIDALLVDEAHEYKHLGFATAMQRGVKGVDPSYSKKSQGVFLKTQAVLSKNHGRNVIFATGTPISNTAAEIWTFMRYLMPSDTMKEYGIYYFDDFVRNFGSIQQMLEFTTSGKFKENNRFAGYIDLPELARIWSSVSDIVLTEEQEELKEKIPETEGGKAQDIYLPQTKALRSVMKYVKKQLTDYDNMSGKEKKENSHIPLTMYGIAKAAAVDARLVDATAEDDINNKTNEAVRQTLRALQETESYKGTVAIFADIYQNKESGFNLYEDIRKKLIEQGVSEKEIFIMKSGMTINKKLEIFDKVNSGEIRVVMGSTFTLGTGVNIQERLHTLIHVDAPNRPMDYTQRNGRILRQGNIHKDMNKPVRILRFGVEDSLDVTAYQRLKTKGAIADSIMNSKQLMANSMENRAIEEEEDVFGDTVAQLSGSEYAMLKNQTEKAVRKFESKKRQWEADQTYIHNAKPRLKGQIFDAERMLEDNSAHLETVTKTFPNGEFKKITIGKMQFDSIDAMSDFIKDFNKKIREESDKIKDNANSNYNSKLVVNIDGLDFVVHTEMTKETTSKGVNIFSKTTRKMYYSQDELGLENVPIKQGLLRNGIEDIVLNVITGHDFAERIDTLNQNIARYKSDLELILARDGKPFEFEKELENAKEKYEEYTEAMKKELEEKEKKYAELDSKVEEAGNLSKATEAEEDENEKDTDSDVLFRRGNVLNSSIDIDEITQHAKAVASVLHLDNIEVVADGSIFEDKKATVKGFYNKKTDKITIIASNHTDIADIEKTVLHEGVAHYGLRKLFGDNFNAFLDTVIVQSEEYVRRKIAEMAAKHEWSFRTAAEEYLAGMAEDANFEQLKPTTWQRIKRLFGEMMSALGLHHSDVTDNDLRYLLWRSYKNLENGGKRSILDMAEDIAMQYRLKVGNYAHTQSGYSNSNILYRSSIDPTENEMLPDAHTRYEKETKEPDKIGSVPKTHNFFRRFYKSYVDSMLALKSYMDSVLEATGDKLSSHEDVYKIENAMTSKNKTHQEAYERDYYNPMIEAGRKLCEAVGMNYDALKMYVVAKHGLERNKYMGERAARNDKQVLEAQEAVERAKKAFADNPTDNNEEAIQAAQAAYELLYEDALVEYSKRDYSGLTDLTGEEDVAMAEKAAQELVDKVEQQPNAMPKVNAFWKKVNAATKATLRTGYESGIMTKEAYEHIAQMYKYYIPLRGWDEAIASDIYTYYGGRFGTGQPLMKTAGGRSSLAEDPLAMIEQMAKRSIIAANRNKMKQAFLNFTLNHPSNLASVSEQWYVKNALDEWERRDAVIPADATPDEISKLVAEHEQEMQALAEKGEAIKQRNGLKLDKRVLNGEGAEHTIKVWRGGKEYVIYINGNPAVAQAVNGLTNPDNRGSKLPKWVDIGLAKLKNFQSAVYTSLSPAFVFKNFVRDQLFASQAVYIKYGLKYKRQATKNAMELFATGALPKLVYKWEHGTLDTSNQTEKLFDEFMRGGGETGFTALRDIEAVKKDIENAINDNKENAAKRGWKAFLRSIEFANRSAEDFSRFVTYMTSRQQGKSIVDAIYDAKDITVNFNKKGSGEMGARYMNFAYVFFNAAVQSINNFATMAKQHPARTALVVSKFGSLGFGIPMMNAFLMAVCGGDDERYWDNMEWIRRNNILLYVPFTKDTFISIPLPHELRPFYGMGEIVTSILFGKETLEGGFVKALEGFTGMLPIDFTGNGGDLATTLTPTVGQPLAQWKSNTDFFGRKVYNDSEYLKNAPEWTKAFSSTPPLLVDITKALNNITGGNAVDKGVVNLNPDIINHLVKGYFGGTAKFVTQMSSLLYKGFSGNTSDIQWRDIPVGSNFVQQLDERSYGSSTNGSYKDFADEAKETESRLAGYKKQVRMGSMEYAEKITELLNSPEYRRYKIAKAYEKPMDLLRETLKHIDDPTDREAVNSALRGLRRRMMETVEDEKKKNFPKHDDDFSFTGEAIDELKEDLKYSIKGLKQGEQERLEEDYDNDAEEYISENKEETMRIIGELNKLLGKKKAK
ncbi:LPD38 domain-containing protein [Prevotella intermedia]|uniref:Helicase C-terminal domain-containing protein n=1 Tax=Prevotella intermedia TaxID=28131 RepID=A0A2A6EER3_PREIN|nr:LPD38 domain-containing protein [Prevotella intermedia]PDP60148.1 hypothetical protein CLI71_06900 [Prevotella intermedia]